MSLANETEPSCLVPARRTHRITRSSPIETQLCLGSSNRTLLIVPSCAACSRAGPLRNSYTPSEVLASDPSRGARVRSHSLSRFSWPPVRARRGAAGGEGEGGREGECGEEGAVVGLEMSAVRTMWACGSVTRQAPVCVSHTFLFQARFVQSRAQASPVRSGTRFREAGGGGGEAESRQTNAEKSALAVMA